ncbi:MAG: PQQ-binding-like beta-propeller repeat protein [Saprospiraceae bacterium]|nr:PQQ-binding-like beta-propeller repeat protein [Saprospiraceae bacterium]
MYRNSLPPRYSIFALLYVMTMSFCWHGCDSKQDHPLPAAGSDWNHYLGTQASTQYSSLTEINRSNVSKLKLAWTYVTGDSAMYQSNNLAIDGIVYTPTPYSRVAALDGATGNEIWSFDPEAIMGDLAETDQRGISYWQDGERGRIMTAKGPYLFQLDAETGSLVTSFGEGGYIHLGEQLDVEGRPPVYLNTPGHVFKDMLITGVNTPENVPGAIRAFDLRSGKRLWIFHTLPRPGEPGSETWPAGYLDRTGGASDWSGLAIDTARGMVYASTETAGPDFYGGWRYGENLYANSVVALDIETGKLKWHQQLVHHDLWDLDNPCPPTLLTIKQDGHTRDVVAQGTKMGLLFVFDRDSGAPIWPIEERPIPESKLPDMKAWPTQPFPTAPPPLMRQRFTEDDISDISPRTEMLSRQVFEKMGSTGSYPAPSLDQTIMFPGYDGGMEWGGSAADPNGILYVNVNEMPWFYQLVPTKKADGSELDFGEKHYRINCTSCHGIDLSGDPAGGFPSLQNIAQKYTRSQVAALIDQGAGRMPAFSYLSPTRKKAIINFLFGEKSTDPSRNPSFDPHEQGDLSSDPPYVFRGFQRWLDEEGYPAIKPPWGTLNAVDLNTGTIKWKVTLGEFEELTERGIPPTGTENYGGPIVTAGGVLFIGATADRMFRAFDAANGELLWQYKLPFDGNATPSTYVADGKQYVIISAGNAKMKPFYAGSLIAFCLDERE